MPTSVHDANLTKQTIAYYNFLQGKERAGIERAVLSNVFALDEFKGGMFVKFITLNTQQSTYLASFLTLTTQENISFYQDQMTHPAVTEVAKLRTLAESKTAGFGVDAVYWFQQATLRIGQLKNVENQIAASLLKFTENTYNESFNTLVIDVVFTLIVLLLVIAIARSLY